MVDSGNSAFSCVIDVQARCNDWMTLFIDVATYPATVTAQIMYSDNTLSPSVTGSGYPAFGSVATAIGQSRGGNANKYVGFLYGYVAYARLLSAFEKLSLNTQFAITHSPTVTNPLSLPTNLVSWWDFTDASTLYTNTAGTIPSTANNDVIRFVADKGPLGNNMVGISGGGPTRRNNQCGINGNLPLIDFQPALAQGLECTFGTPITGQNCTVFMVAKIYPTTNAAPGLFEIQAKTVANAGAYASGMGFYNATDSPFFYSNTTNYGYVYRTSYQSLTSWVAKYDTTENVYMVTQNGNAGVLYGATPITLNGPYLNLGTRWTGGSYGNTEGTYMCNLWVSEMAVWNRALTAQEILQLQVYCQNKYGVSEWDKSGPKLWIDLQATANLFQDSAGTIPVTTNGQNLGRINNSAGEGGAVTLSDVVGKTSPQYTQTGAITTAGIKYPATTAALRYNPTTTPRPVNPIPIYFGAFTITMVVTTPTVSGTSMIVTAGQSGVADCPVYLYNPTSTTVGLDVYNGGDRQFNLGLPLATKAVISVTKYYNGYMAFANTSAPIYVTGSAVVTTAGSANTQTYIGSTYNSSTETTRIIHELRIWQRCLSKAELDVIHASLKTKWAIP